VAEPARHRRRHDLVRRATRRVALGPTVAMKRAIVIAFAACRPAPAPVLTNAFATTKQPRVPFVPCPSDSEGPIEHELFRGCAPAPFHEPIATCPHGECPRPCRVQLVGGGTEQVTYDPRGRLIRAQGNESRLLDQSCTYDHDRLDECQLLYEGRPVSTEKVWRDAAARIIGTSNGEPMVGYDPHYTWADGRVVREDSTMHSAELHFVAGRLVKLDEDDMGEKQQITYTYDADGDVIASSRDGAYVYDSQKRLVSFGKVKLEWDGRDRLIRSTVADTQYEYSYDCK
jgi:hypothetical protein